MGRLSFDDVSAWLDSGSATSPEARRRWLDAHDVKSDRRRESEATYARSQIRSLPTLSEQYAELDWLMRANDWRRTVTQRLLDGPASVAEGRMVYRTSVVNLDCAFCGAEASMPQPDPDAPFLCGGCARDAYQARQAEAAEADLQMRTQAAFIDEVIGDYDRPGGLPNPLRDRPVYRGRIAQR